MILDSASTPILVLQKICFSNYAFFLLKCQLSQQKLTQHFCKDFPRLSRRGIRVIKVILSSFQNNSFFKFSLIIHILTSQLCLRTPTQTSLSSYQSTRTIFLILHISRVYILALRNKKVQYFVKGICVKRRGRKSERFDWFSSTKLTC